MQIFRLLKGHHLTLNQKHHGIVDHVDDLIGGDVSVVSLLHTINYYIPYSD